MRKILTFIAFFLFIGTSFAEYVLPLSIVKKVKEVATQLIYKVDNTYSPQQRKNIYWGIVDSIDWYIITHNLNNTQKAVLLCLKTILLEHMGYKIGNPIPVKVINDING